MSSGAAEPVHPGAEREPLGTQELLELMNREDAGTVAAVAAVLGEVAAAVDAVAARLAAGGRLRYIGAGTSGRLAELDAAECPATFGVPPETVSARVAGAASSGPDDEAAAEDDVAAGAKAAEGLGPGDVAVGVSASGSTPYVAAALEAAAAAGSLTIAITCRPGSRLGRLAAQAIEVEVGPEVVSGSTRLKAGTAQKLILNMMTTATFARLGLVFRGRMVGVRPANAKLKRRAAAIVRDLAGSSLEQAEAAVQESGDVRVATLMLRLGMSRAEAAERLSQAGGRLSVALGGL